MSAGIEVKEFKHIPGKNDAEYIKLLKEHNENWKRIATDAVAKIKKLSAQLKEQPEILACGEGELNVPDTNIPSNSALDHIHNVVRDDAYRRGYEQGKKDAKVEAIPVDWIKKHAAKLDRIGWWSDVRAINVMLLEWREEQNNG